MSEHTPNRNKVLENQVRHEKKNLYRLEMEADKLQKELYSTQEYNFSLKQKLSDIKKNINKLKFDNLKTKQKISIIKTENTNILKEISQSEKQQNNFKTSIVENHYPKLLNTIQNATFGNKEKAIFRNISQVLIDTTLNNEFSEVKWKAIMNSDGTKVGMRIKFFEMAMLKTDVKRVYGPVTNALKNQYRYQGLSLKVNYTHVRGVITCLDFFVYVEKQAKAELPYSSPSDC